MLDFNFFALFITEIRNHNIFAEAHVLFLIIGNTFDVSSAFAEILNQ